MRSNSFMQKTTSAAFPPEPRAEEAQLSPKTCPPPRRKGLQGAALLCGEVAIPVVPGYKAQ